MTSVIERAWQGLSLSCALAMPATAYAHDLGGVLIAYALGLALPVPALWALLGWKLAIPASIALCLAALLVAQFGNFFFFTVLFAPYVAWAGRALWNRRGRAERQ